YIIMSTPVEPVHLKATQYVDAILICYIIIAVILFILLFGLYLQTSLPLKAMKQAAKEYAAGHYDYDMPAYSGHDHADLAGAIKYLATKMKDTNEYQKNFIANVSHDFRSPLTSIKGYTQAMADGTIPPEMQGKYLDIILFEVERLTKLTNNLLSLSEFENKGIPLEISTFDINSELKRCLATFEQRCTKKHISLDITFDAQVSLVDADQGKIEQVIQNLVDNAIKFSNDNSTIEIHTKEKNQKIFISIKDHGIGIPKESLGKVWNRFYKTDLSRGKDKKGTGLGLSITKEIILAHKENINVISTEGVGTEFIFSLPVADDGNED
ncbi:MAG: HAMP domain-containing sensor histidine kinase, partial [Lachnospiraceae bacterium]|nr:HAMP domain-containing sensor histidine kinase [Lachnospiraceae bacterium]